MDIFLERKKRRFASGHRTVGEEDEDRNYHGGTRWWTSWRAEAWKRIDIFGVWEWMDGSWLYRSYIYMCVCFNEALLSFGWVNRLQHSCCIGPRIIWTQSAIPSSCWESQNSAQCLPGSLWPNTGIIQSILPIYEWYEDAINWRETTLKRKWGDGYDDFCLNKIQASEKILGQVEKSQFCSPLTSLCRHLDSNSEPPS